MGKKPAIALWLIAFLAVALLGSWLIARRAQGRRQAAGEARCMAEAQAALEAYLRGEPGAAGPLRGGPTGLDRAAVLDRFGELREITGSQYSGAGWNIQGYHYVTAHRTAVFAKASVRLQIHVTEGRKTAPGQAAVRVTALDYDHSNGMTAFVAHPDLVDPDAPAPR
jgi:hypothetical protein